MSTLPERLRQLRQQTGLTQEALARAVNLSVGTVSKLEEKAIDPKLSTVVALARALGVTLDELAGDDGSDKPPGKGGRKRK
jgi:transcriptional regulator with XRE-family HTH domain